MTKPNQTPYPATADTTVESGDPTHMDIGAPPLRLRGGGWGVGFVLLTRGLLFAGLLVMLFYLTVYVAFAANLISFPYDYDQGEGFELVDVMMFSRGEMPYADIETYPFYGSIYPPLYHILLMPFAWIFGPAYWYGRLWSFLTTLVTAGTIAFIVYREATHQSHRHHGTARLIAVIAGLAWIASPIVYHIGPLFRQHIGMVMFEALAVAILANVNEIASQSKRRRRLLLGFILLLAAGYTKQLAAFTALAALISLFIRNPRRAVIWGIGFALAGAAIFLALNIVTGGNWWTQTITANVKEFSLDQARGLFKVFINLHRWLLIPAIFMVVYETYFDRISIYSLWFVSTAGLNGYAAGTWGAGDSYYATPIAAACVLSGIFAARTFTGGWRYNNNVYARILRLGRHGGVSTLENILREGLGWGLRIIIPLLFLAYGRAVIHMPTNVAPFSTIADALNIHDNTGYDFHDPDGYITFAYAQIGHFLTDADRVAGEEIVALMNKIPPEIPILSEEAGFSFAADRDVITNPVVLMLLWEAGEFDSSALVEMLNGQEFGMVILRARFYPQDVNRAITINYEEVRHIRMNGFDYIIKYPRAQPLESLPDDG